MKEKDSAGITGRIIWMDRRPEVVYVHLTVRGIQEKIETSTFKKSNPNEYWGWCDFKVGSYVTVHGVWSQKKYQRAGHGSQYLNVKHIEVADLRPMIAEELREQEERVGEHYERLASQRPVPPESSSEALDRISARMQTLLNAGDLSVKDAEGWQASLAECLASRPDEEEDDAIFDFVHQWDAYDYRYIV
jgi:hypothetical protein